MNYKLINFCEFDKYAAQSFCAIHNEPESKNLGDITKVNEKEIADFNTMVGGSPCQDFSVAGKQEGAKWTCKDCNYEYNPLEAHYSTRNKCPKCSSTNIEKTRSSLLVEWLRVLREKKPNLAIYENVKNIVGKQFKQTFDLFEKELQEYGYNTYWKVLSAKDYGIPQNRERVYLIIIKKELDNGKFKFPAGFDNGIRLKDILEKEVDEKYYISQEKTDKLISQLKNKTVTNYMEFSNAITSNYKNGCATDEIGKHRRQLVINVGNTNPSGNGMNGCVYSEEGIAPTITTNKGEGSKILQIGMLDIKGNEQIRRVYDPEGLSPTLNTMGGGNRQPKIIEDNGLIQIGMLEGKGFESRRRVYSSDGLSPTLHGIGSGGNTEPKILEDFYSNRDIREYEDYSPTLRADRQGLKVVQGCSTRTRNYIGQPEQLEIRKDELSNSITTVQKDSMATDYYRIRKLTPLECFRLMGFSDEDYYILKENGISDSQIYKMAGNSIVTDVLYYILLEIHKAMPYLLEDIKLSSFFSGIGAFEKALIRLQETIHSQINKDIINY